MYDVLNNRFHFDTQKTIEVLLYLSAKTTDLYKILKLLYFADIYHLGKFGRFVSGDYYSALRHGPVPSQAYDLLKTVRGDSPYKVDIPDLDSTFSVTKYTVTPKRDPNLNYLSNSDIEALDYAFQNYGNCSFDELHELSSNNAYLKTQENDEISVLDIAEDLPNSAELIEYLRQS